MPWVEGLLAAADAWLQVAYGGPSRPDRLAVGWPAADHITEYVKVEPTLVVEVRADIAAQAGRWRQGLLIP